MQAPLQSTGSNNPQLPDYLQVKPVQNDPSGNYVDESERESAANIIRQKLASIYAGEPDAAQQAQIVEKAEQTSSPMSPHQQYMQTLSDSGRSHDEVQNAWRAYYDSLSDTDKHAVWQEFYAAHTSPQVGQPAIPAPVEPVAPVPAAPIAAAPVPTPVSVSAPAQPSVIQANFTPTYQPPAPPQPSRARTAASVADIKQNIRNKVSSGGRLKKNDHFKSLAFGLGSGFVVVFITLFTFFNEVFITPFIQPSRQAAETPVIVDPASAVVGDTPKVIIPKINLEIPADYSQTRNDNATIEAALDNGIVHYPGTARPGQAGNAAFFGHSSNNIFNSGKYKFAFVLLHKVSKGDTFYLTYEGKAYVYEVIDRKVVEPTEVGVLDPVPGQYATATLITCDPPGTSLKRLVVVGKQISPDPAGNVVPTPGEPSVAAAPESDNLPGNGPTLWSRLWNSIF